MSIMIGIGISPSLNTGGGGAPAPSLLAVGSTALVIGDGIMAASSSPNICNGWFHFMRRMNMRLQPTVLPVLAQSGSTIATDIASNKYWVNPTAIDNGALQNPHLVIFGSMGANDDLLATDPGANPASGSTTNPLLQDYYNAVDYAITQFPTQTIIFPTTLPSDKTGETTIDGGQTLNRRQRVSAAQIAHIAGKGLARLVSVDFSTYNATTYNETTGLHVHPKQEGGWKIGDLLFNAVDPLVDAATPQQVRDMIQAGTYPYMGTAQLDTDYDMVGTGGTVTGLGGGSTAPTSKLASTTITGVTVSSAATVVSGPRQKNTMNVPAGTISGAGRVLFQDKSNFNFSTSNPGAYCMTGLMYKVPAGFLNAGSDLGSVGGTTGGGGAAVGAGTATAPTTYGFDCLWYNEPTVVAGASTLVTKRSNGVYYGAGVVASMDFEHQQPFAYVVDRRTGQTPAYLGETKRVSDALYLTGAAQRLRPTGTISQAAGGTIRIDAGTWHPQGLDNTNFASRRLYKGTVANTGVGTGTLIATLSGSTWTSTLGAAAVSTGDLIYAEIDVTLNAVTVTVRSVITITAT